MRLNKQNIQTTLRWIWNHTGTAIVFAFILAAFIFGYTLGKDPDGMANDPHANHGHNTSSGTPATAVTWTCSMHPQIRKLTKGKCPICAMALIPANGLATEPVYTCEGLPDENGPLFRF